MGQVGNLEITGIWGNQLLQPLIFVYHDVLRFAKMMGTGENLKTSIL